jgi:hypothetical protein
MKKQITCPSFITSQVKNQNQNRQFEQSGKIKIKTAPYIFDRLEVVKEALMPARRYQQVSSIRCSFNRSNIGFGSK